MQQNDSAGIGYSGRPRTLSPYSTVTKEMRHAQSHGDSTVTKGDETAQSHGDSTVTKVDETRTMSHGDSTVTTKMRHAPRLHKP